MSRLLVVLAMHRSGSSLVARSLKALGAELGQAAEWSGPDNPTGFWEHQGVLTVNEAVLILCGATWDNPPTTIDLNRQLRRPELVYLLGAAEHMLRRELNQYPIFAIKDPRLCVLMPFWRPVFAGLGCDLSVVQVVRHPNAVAASLQRRNGMDRENALRLWSRYTEDAIFYAATVPKAVTAAYGVMVIQPISEIARIGEKLGLTVDKDEAMQFATAFVDENLWHEADEEPLPMEVDIVWQQVRREATEP